MKAQHLLLFVLLMASVAKSDVNLDELKRFNNAILLAFKQSITEEGQQDALKTLAEGINNEDCRDRPENWGADLKLSVAEEYTNTYANLVYLNSLPPAKAVPLLSALLENDELTDRNEKILEGKYRRPYYAFVNSIIAEKLGLTTYSQEYVTMSWYPKDVPISKDQMIFFWNYFGLKYLPVLWNDWYTCWKLENQRENPRKEILERLAQEIVLHFGNNVFPFVADAIKNGDKTLQPVIDFLPGGYEIRFSNLSPMEKGFKDSETFLQWWSENKNDYAVERQEKSLESLKHIFERKTKPATFDLQIYDNIAKMKKAIEDYDSSANRAVTNSWYYKLAD